MGYLGRWALCPHSRELDHASIIQQVRWICQQTSGRHWKKKTDTSADYWTFFSWFIQEIAQLGIFLE